MQFSIMLSKGLSLILCLPFAFPCIIICPVAFSINLLICFEGFRYQQISENNYLCFSFTWMSFVCCSCRCGPNENKWIQRMNELLNISYFNCVMVCARANQISHWNFIKIIITYIHTYNIISGGWAEVHRRLKKELDKRLRSEACKM